MDPNFRIIVIGLIVLILVFAVGAVFGHYLW